ncbi:MAG TPA: Rieske 2Fe-2S domain-containing protein [Pseudomonadales bacterium]
MPAIDITDLPDHGSRGFTINGEPCFVVLKDGLPYAYKNSCPHLGVALEWEEDKFLDFEGVLIQCAMHGALFLIETGECVSGPCLGQALEPIPAHLDNGQLIIASDG